MRVVAPGTGRRGQGSSIVPGARSNALLGGKRLEHVALELGDMARHGVPGPIRVPPDDRVKDRPMTIH